MPYLSRIACLLTAISFGGTEPVTNQHSSGGAAPSPPSRPVQGWLNWRGPLQNGVSLEEGLPNRWRPGPKGINALWSIDLSGRGTPVIARYGGEDRVYAFGYVGTGTKIREVLRCLDARNGQTVWQHQFNDFLSDIIYDRYSIGAPAVDRETGNVYLLTSPGLLVCLDRDGRLLWERSLMEELGRLTFPNGRTGAPAIDGGLVIISCISTNWGREGPARNRFYGFDTRTGDLVWSSTPAVGPPFLKDSSFSSPVFEWRNGKRVFYAGTGCGNIVCVNARTGEPLWRFQLAIGGVNSSVVLHEDVLIAIHGKENTDDTGHGRMVAIDLKKALDQADAASAKGKSQKLPFSLDYSFEVWRNNDLSMFTSSPVLVGNRVYQVTAMGDLVCVNADTGQTLWHEKLGADQLHASPVSADGKLYVPTWHDGFYIIHPTDRGAEILDQVKSVGACLGSPSIWNGSIYIHTINKLFCFGRTDGSRASSGGSEETGGGAAIPNDRLEVPTAGPSRIQVVPSEVRLRPGERQQLRLRGLDHLGQDLGPLHGGIWRKFVPPQAKVIAYLDADVSDGNEIIGGRGGGPSAGAFEVRLGDLRGHVRGRLLPSPPYMEDLESFELKHTAADGAKFAYPPLPWIGARLKWEVREVAGTKVLAKTLDRILFQRSMVFFGHPDDRNYTITADVMSDGNRRIMSTAGVINQRYIIALVGNAQILEVVSNHDRVKASVPFVWKQRVWYRIKTRVDVSADGSGVIRAKAWQRGSEEPDEWTIEVRHLHPHRNGSPGLFGFSPQSRFRVYVDNVSVMPN